MSNEISKFNCRVPKPIKVLFKKLYSQHEMLSVDRSNLQGQASEQRLVRPGWELLVDQEGEAMREPSQVL